jgi:hypothetical protein
MGTLWGQRALFALQRLPKTAEQKVGGGIRPSSIRILSPTPSLQRRSPIDAWHSRVELEHDAARYWEKEDKQHSEGSRRQNIGTLGGGRRPMTRVKESDRCHTVRSDELEDRRHVACSEETNDEV